MTEQREAGKTSGKTPETGATNQGGTTPPQFQTQAQKKKPGENEGIRGSQTDAQRGGGNEGSSGAGG